MKMKPLLNSQIEIPAPTEIILPPQDGDAIEIGDLYREGKSSMVNSVRCLIEAGRRLTAKKESLQHGDWLPWLEANADALGFESRFTAAKLMRAAERTKCVVDGTFDAEEAAKLNREIWGNNGGHRTIGTGNDEHYTLAKYIELARKVLGGIDLDPASCVEAQKTVQATSFYTKEDNALVREWQGCVWLNPPYSTPLLSELVDKLINEVGDGRVSEAIMLTNNCTDTSWFHKAAEIASAICFTRGRINFHGGGSPTCGQTFFYFGNQPRKFAETFLEVGLTMVPAMKALEHRLSQGRNESGPAATEMKAAPPRPTVSTKS